MASHQYTFQLIPEEEALMEMCLPSLEVTELWENNWWLERGLNYNKLEHILNSSLPRIEWTSKLDDLKEFGNNETNDISISLKSNKVTSIHVRIDLRDIDSDFINVVFKIARDNECLLFDTDGQVYSPNRKLLKENISKSKAFQFVKNPEQFLNNLISND